MSKSRSSAWSWVPSLYYAEGIPYILVMVVSVIMYKRLGISNTEIALYTGLLYLPWILKALWSPFVDTIKTKRWWIISMQLLIGAGLVGIALVLPGPNFFKYSLAIFVVIAFSSATHDIAADGFYMLGLNSHDQAWFVGIRSTFYRLAMITGQGLLVILAGSLESLTGLPPAEVNVQTVVGSQNAPSSVEWIAPDSVAMMSGSDLSIFPEELSIELTQVDPELADSIVAQARRYNIANGFYEDEKPVQKKPGLWSRTVGRPWSKHISSPLESFLRRHFPDDRAAPAGRTGNLGIAYLSVAAPPDDGKELVVNFGRSGGDKNIALIEGTRFTVDQANYNKPLVAVFRVDPKLDFATHATFQARSGAIAFAWASTFYLIAAIFIGIALYHRWRLPFPAEDTPGADGDDQSIGAELVETVSSFVRKPGVGIAVLFFLLYRLGESQLVKLASPFLLDGVEVGGLSLTTGEVGFVYGTAGVLSLVAGGLLGGFLAARNGLKYWLWPMVIAINLPNLVYVYLSTALPTNFVVINLCVIIEQFGYGFGFTAYMLYMIHFADGQHKTAHFAFCTALMALGMMIPGMLSGWLEDIIGYQNFFIWVMLATIPGFIVTALIKIDPAFGKKEDAE